MDTGNNVRLSSRGVKGRLVTTDLKEHLASLMILELGFTFSGNS